MPTIAERAAELRQTRARLTQEQRAITERAIAESRDLTAEERQQDERMDTEFTSASDELRRLERDLAREAELRGAPAGIPAGGGDDGDGGEPEQRTRRLTPFEERQARVSVDAYNDAFMDAIRGFEIDAESRSLLEAEVRAGMAVGVDADGGFTVPEGFFAQFITFLEEENAIRSLANVVNTASGNPIKWPKLVTNADKPEITDESTPIATTKPVWGKITLNAYKWAEIIKASEEFVQDTGAEDITGWLALHLAMLFSQAEGAKYAVGTGTDEPQGLITGATLGKTAALTTAFTIDECIDLQYSVRSPYRRNASWIGNDLTLAFIRKLKASDGHYYWQPSVMDGQPDRFLGRPIYSDPDVPTIAAGARVLGFGDVRRAYTVRDAGGLQIRYLGERFADEGDVAWRGTMRTDGRITDDHAFKVMRIAP